MSLVDRSMPRPLTSPSRWAALSPTRRLVLAVAVLFAVTSLATFVAPSGIFAWDPDSFSSSSEAQLVTLTNRARASAGLRALKVDSTLTSVARWRSKDMIERDYFSHTIPGYGKVWDKLAAIDYCYNVAGENIGWNNYPDDLATSAIQSSFMGSPDHQANIMGSTWDVIGVGAYKGSDGKKMWTVLFADKCGSTTSARSRPPSRRPGRPRDRRRDRLRTGPRDRHRSRRRRPEPRPRPGRRRSRPRHATSTPTPTPTPGATDDSGAPISSADLLAGSDDPGTQPSDAPSLAPTATPTGGIGTTDDPIGMRVVDSGASGGLLETIVGGVAGFFFGG